MIDRLIFISDIGGPEDCPRRSSHRRGDPEHNRHPCSRSRLARRGLRTCRRHRLRQAEAGRTSVAGSTPATMTWSACFDTPADLQNKPAHRIRRHGWRPDQPAARFSSTVSVATGGPTPPKTSGLSTLRPANGRNCSHHHRRRHPPALGPTPTRPYPGSHCPLLWHQKRCDSMHLAESFAPEPVDRLTRGVGHTASQSAAGNRARSPKSTHSSKSVATCRGNRADSKTSDSIEDRDCGERRQQLGGGSTATAVEQRRGP